MANQWTNLGDAYRMNQMLDSAIYCYNKFIMIHNAEKAIVTKDKSYPYHLIGLSQLLYKQGDCELPLP
jgi:hypothetical protein